MAVSNPRAILSVQQAQEQARRATPNEAMAQRYRAQAQLQQAIRQAQIVQQMRSSDTVRTAQFAVQLSECSGTIFIEGPGELAYEVLFPVAFIEKPAISGGFELVENTSPEAGNFPTCSVGVLRWITHTPDPIRTYWKGAVLSIVTTGKTEPVPQLFYAHWQMRGRALRNPIGTSPEVL